MICQRQFACEVSKCFSGVSCRTKLPLNCQSKTMGNSREEKYHRPINYTPIPEQIQFKIGKFIYRRKLDINSRACIRKSTVLERFVHLDLGCLPRGRLFIALGQGVVGRWKKNKGGVGVAEREKRQDGSPPLKEEGSYNGNFMYGSWRWRTNEFMICSQFSFVWYYFLSTTVTSLSTKYKWYYVLAPGSLLWENPCLQYSLH